MSDDTALADLKAKFEAFLLKREERDRTKLLAEKASKAYTEAQAILYEELEEAGSKGTYTFDFGGKLGEAKFGRRATPRARVIDKQAAIASLKALGHGDVVLQEDIAQGRLNDLVRGNLETDHEMPEGVDFYHTKVITVSRKKPKGAKAAETLDI